MSHARAETNFFTFDAAAGTTRAHTKLPCFSRVCAALVIAAAALVLLGWITGVQALLRLLPSAVAMKPMTAVVVLAAGSSLWRLARENKTRRVDGWAQLLALGVLVVGTLKLVGDYAGWGFRIEDLLFPRKLAQFATYGPSEMAPNTALGFVFCGLALLLIDVRRPRRVTSGQVAILALSVISLLALTGYAYHVLLFYRLGSAEPMSFECAICFGLLCVGYLAARPGQGLMKVVTSRTTGGTVARRLLPVAILIPLALGALLLWGERARLYAWEFSVSTFAAASVVIFSVLIWWNASLLYAADRERARAERRLAAQHEATRVLAESNSTPDALDRVLHALCEGLGFNLGCFWTHTSGIRRLQCSAAWCASEEQAGEFLSASRNAARDASEDLPGQVWTGGSAIWLADLSKATRFPRAALAAKAGLRSGGAFPIQVDHETYGVMEFFSRAAEVADPALQRMLSTVGTQLGLFIKRVRAEEQLRQTSANLQRSNTDLQQFAHIASHDLFEPLRMVTSYLQLLSYRYGGQLDAEADEFIQHAVDGARRMHALINDLLEYSRVDTRGRSFKPTELDEVVSAATGNLKVAFEESGAQIACAQLPRVNGDHVQLTQLFQNLIGNAIKFRRAEPPRVEISAKRRGGEWRVSVHDNGIGIDPKYFDRVFVLFQRLHTRQEYAGTGMGLAICKKIVERHGGRIWVESQPGQGATFWFTLPEAK